MVNILGDWWREGAAPPWERLFKQPQTKLHLYGKQQARVGRKMGHYNCLAAELDEAIDMAEQVRAELTTRRTTRS
jgi:5-(carboxyamino)imidazole ribonucleotide synthase